MRLALALCSIVCACGSKPTSHLASKSGDAIDVNLAPMHRLGDASVPKAYALHMQMDPSAGVFQGAVDIDVDVTQRLHTFWLHQKDLIIESASFERDGRRQALEIRGPEDDEMELLGLFSPSEIGAGQGRLHIVYKAHFGTVAGLFRQREESRWYAFTDFEATDARAAFPCYDDPRFKVPWTITIDVPAGDSAFSNAKQSARTTLPDGKVRFVFAPTRPLPSYLVAMAAGPFEYIEGMASKTPLRIIAPHGQAERGRFVLETTDTWLRFFESYLGMALPYAKLDFIAVPHFSGAMENPGLVTFASNILLTGSHATDEALRLAAGVTTHELAHMWFGDLITPQYWNDLWLNEGFATWLSDKAVAAYQPHRSREILDIADKSSAFASDHSLHGRRVREPIESPADVREAFDAITYRKGGALLTMLEAWIGAETMQRAVRRYASSFVDGSVRTEDLLTEFLAATNNRQILSFLHSQLGQTGIPQITFAIECEQSPRLTLSQRRYLPITSSHVATERDLERLWQLPICFRYGTDTESYRHCEFLDQAERQIELKGVCPTWLQPNDGESGYYHSLLAPDAFAALATRPLDPRETQGIVQNLVAAVRSGDMRLGEALVQLAPHARSRKSELQKIIVPFVYEIWFALIGPDERHAFATMIRNWYGTEVRVLGLDAKAGESPYDRQMRPVLLRLVGELGEDAELRAMVRIRVTQLLARDERIDLDLLQSLLEIAAIDGDSDLMASYVAAMARVSDHRMGGVLLGALHAFADPTLFANALELGFAAKKSHNSVWPLLISAMRDPARQQEFWRALNRHRARLLEGDAEEALEMLSQISSGLCSAEAVAATKNFSGDEIDVKELIERIEGCMAFAGNQSASALATFASGAVGP